MNRNNINAKPILSRRQLLGLVAGSTAAGLIGSPLAAFGATTPTPVAASGAGRIVKVHFPGMRQKWFPHPIAARQMVDRAICGLAGVSDPGRAWAKYLSATDRVGIKINCLGTRPSSSMKEIVYAIADSIRDFGVADANIVIFDMFASNMMGGRFNQRTNRRKMRVLAHKEGQYQKPWIKAGPAKARFSEILQWTTAIINVPPIKDHDLAGVTCTMKNMTFGTVEKPHLNHHCVNEAIAHLWATEQIRSRVRVNIVDGSTILYEGGPKRNLKAMVPHECLYATTDPVAMDTIAGQLIEEQRAANRMRTLAAVGRPPKFLKLAEELGLGIADPTRIRLETIELPPFTPLSK